MVYNLAHREVLARARLGRRCVGLTPIGSNRQKRIYDAVLAGSIASIWCPSSSLARVYPDPTAEPAHSWPRLRFRMVH
jgi:hypothetical protein